VSEERSGPTGPVGEPPDPDEVASRAEGRPPEERSSDDPTGQAEVILEESEARIEEGAAKSTEG
jgi:hypothetical protein